MNLSTSQLALWFLLSSTAKTTSLLGLAASAAYLLRHHSATKRHYVWALGVASSMALPLLMLRSVLPVVFHAVVGMDGKLLSFQVLNSQINPDLARAAVEAVSQWRHQSALVNGEPVEVDTTITVNFKLLP